VKILTSLLENEKKYGELQKETKLQSNILSEYLKNLQKLGLVDRDVDSREYRGRIPVTVQVLFFNEVMEFIRAQLEKLVELGNERAGIISGLFGWFVVTEGVELRKSIENWLKDPKIMNALSFLSESMEDLWDHYVFSIYDRKLLEKVETYKNYLLKVSEVVLKLTDVNEKVKEIFSSRDLRELSVTLEVIEKYGKLKKDLTDEEMRELEDIAKYLKDPRNRQIYDSYLNKLNKVPKSLIIYPSWGFKGYPQKIMDLIPKQDQMKKT
jgi:hypothetical protein